MLQLEVAGLLAEVLVDFVEQAEDSTGPIFKNCISMYICLAKKKAKSTWSGMFDAGLEGVSSLAFWGFNSSLGTISMRKSNWSYLEIAIAISFLCSVRLLLSSV